MQTFNIGDRVNIRDTEDVGIVYMASLETLETETGHHTVVMYCLVSEFISFDDEVYSGDELMLVNPASAETLIEARTALDEEESEEDEEESEEDEEESEDDEEDALPVRNRGSDDTADNH